MIALDGDRGDISDPVDTLRWLGIVSSDIACADDLLYGWKVVENRFECGQVRVYTATSVLRTRSSILPPTKSNFGG